MSSQHAKSTRKCPGCGQEKEIEGRSKYCSHECYVAGRSRANRAFSPIPAPDPSAPVAEPLAAQASEVREQEGDNLTITLPRTRIKTLEELLDHCAVDTSVWNVDRFVVNKWEVGMGPAAIREHIVEPLFQVKAWLSRKVAVVAARDELRQLKEDAKARALSFPAIARTNEPAGNMLEISIPDLHAGKLAWAKETGWENYDIRIAPAMFNDALAALIDRTSAYRFDEVCFVVGNDLLNADNKNSQTTAGTVVSSDGRFQKSFSVVRHMVTDAVERLRQIAPVRVVMVPGNHDTLAVWHLGDSLECYFHKCPDVSIDNEPRLRKYHQFGRVMLMFYHGDKGKVDDYPLLMATEQSEMFGATAWREAHIGHLHKTMSWVTKNVNEHHGVRVRMLPSLCAADAWHAENGFVANVRSAEAFVWNRNEGLLGTAIYSPPTGADSRVA